jgi:lathosterol oxidase
MDIVLGVADTWLLDRLYSAVLPRQDIHSGNLTDLFYGQKPVEIDLVSQHFNWQPSEHAYLSRFQRDDPVRQLVSLYLITWYFYFPPYFLVLFCGYVYGRQFLTVSIGYLV